jgi:hypothetical protein
MTGERHGTDVLGMARSDPLAQDARFDWEGIHPDETSDHALKDGLHRFSSGTTSTV